MPLNAAIQRIQRLMGSTAFLTDGAGGSAQTDSSKGIRPGRGLLLTPPAGYTVPGRSDGGSYHIIFVNIYIYVCDDPRVLLCYQLIYDPTRWDQPPNTLGRFLRVHDDSYQRTSAVGRSVEEEKESRPKLSRPQPRLERRRGEEEKRGEKESRPGLSRPQPRLGRRRGEGEKLGGEKESRPRLSRPQRRVGRRRGEEKLGGEKESRPGLSRPD